jgi:energy-converting hydrogenase A subunit M
MYITILDYNNGTTHVRRIGEDIKDMEAEDIVHHLAQELEINVSDCHWMVHNTIKVHV